MAEVGQRPRDPPAKPQRAQVCQASLEQRAGRSGVALSLSQPAKDAAGSSDRWGPPDRSRARQRDLGKGTRLPVVTLLEGQLGQFGKAFGFGRRMLGTPATTRATTPRRMSNEADVVQDWDLYIA